MLHKGRDEPSRQFAGHQTADTDVVHPLRRHWSQNGEALGIHIEKILDGGSRIIIDQKAWRGEIHDYLKTPNGREKLTFL
jgi:hypothetical protein